jgi:mono/diheme cytochrome c family protein
MKILIVNGLAFFFSMFIGSRTTIAQIQSKQERQEKAQGSLALASEVSFLYYLLALNSSIDLLQAQETKVQAALSSLQKVDSHAATKKFAKNYQTFSESSEPSLQRADHLFEILADYVQERPLITKAVRSPDLELGQQTFKNHCSSCHSEETPITALRKLRHPPTRFISDDKLSDFRTTFFVYLHTSLGIERRGMPAFLAVLDDHQSWSVAAYVIKLTHDGIVCDVSERGKIGSFAENFDRPKSLWNKRVVESKLRVLEKSSKEISEQLEVIRRQLHCRL